MNTDRIINAIKKEVIKEITDKLEESSNNVSTNILGWNYPLPEGYEGKKMTRKRYVSLYDKITKRIIESMNYILND